MWGGRARGKRQTFSCLLRRSSWFLLIWLSMGCWYQVVASASPSVRVLEAHFMPLQFLGRFGQIFWLISSCCNDHHTFFWYVSLSFTALVLSIPYALRGQISGLWASVGTRISWEWGLAHSFLDSLPLYHLSSFIFFPCWVIEGDWQVA